MVYGELHSAENAANVTAYLRRAAAWFVEQGCGPVDAVLFDNAKCFTGPCLQVRAHRAGRTADPLPALHAAWNGKLERFGDTLDTEWTHRRV